ncbi:MAG: TrmB family transcriptional regulator [Thaumarchaeota archaeon]|nr:MAG: TrmB family transcriptional regulator [Nitrososphaerota archaeon]TLX82087.1 MAG: TrmB family transcriptional regulator [Nitrososphaerota archaeon]
MIFIFGNNWHAIQKLYKDPPCSKKPLMEKSERVQINVFDAEKGDTLYEQKEKMLKMTQELSQFGFAPNQAKVYIYLGKYGPKTASEVFKALQLPRSETYFILNLLQNRGIVTAEFSSPTKYFAIPLDQTLSLLINTEKEKLNTLTQKQQDLKKLWDTIPSLTVEKDVSKNEKLQTIQGIECIYSKIKNLVETAKEEILIFCSEKDLSGFYHADIIDILPSSLDVKIIVSPANKTPSFFDEINKKIIRLLPTSSSENQCYIIKDTDEVLLFLRNTIHPSNNLFAVWSDSKSLIDSMHALFSYSWINAKVCR